MATLSFNRVHKNGWISYKTAGVAGAVFIDKRHVTPEFLANPPASIELNVEGLLPAGANATEASQAKAAKKVEAEAKKAERATAALAKSEAKLAKLKAAADKAQEKAAALAAKAGAASAPPAAAVTETVQ